MQVRDVPALALVVDSAKSISPGVGRAVLAVDRPSQVSRAATGRGRTSAQLACRSRPRHLLSRCRPSLGSYVRFPRCGALNQQQRAVQTAVLSPRGRRPDGRRNVVGGARRGRPPTVQVLRADRTACCIQFSRVGGAGRDTPRPGVFEASRVKETGTALPYRQVKKYRFGLLRVRRRRSPVRLTAGKPATEQRRSPASASARSPGRAAVLAIVGRQPSSLFKPSRARWSRCSDERGVWRQICTDGEPAMSLSSVEPAAALRGDLGDLDERAPQVGLAAAQIGGDLVEAVEQGGQLAPLGTGGAVVHVDDLAALGEGHAEAPAAQDQPHAGRARGGRRRGCRPTAAG